MSEKMNLVWIDGIDYSVPDVILTQLRTLRTENEELKAELETLREEINKLLKTWQKMPTDKDADEWTEEEFELSREFAALMDTIALSE